MWLGISVSALVAGIPAQFGGWPLRERSTSSASLAAAASGGLDIWADDTAGLWLDNGIITSGDGSGGRLLWAADGNLGSNCASGESRSAHPPAPAQDAAAPIPRCR